MKRKRTKFATNLHGYWSLIKRSLSGLRCRYFVFVNFNFLFSFQLMKSLEHGTSLAFILQGVKL